MKHAIKPKCKLQSRETGASGAEIEKEIVQNEENVIRAGLVRGANYCSFDTGAMSYDFNTRCKTSRRNNAVIKEVDDFIKGKPVNGVNANVSCGEESEKICELRVTEANRLDVDAIKSNESKRGKQWDIVWTRVLVIGFFHLAGLYGATLRYDAKWQSQIFGRIIAVLSSYSVTAGAHRLWSHRSYKANYAYQIMLMLLMSFIYQNSIYVWVRDHRVHHQFSETDADPHNAKRGFFFSHVGWLMLKKHPDVRRKGGSVDMTDLEANPIVMFQHRHYHKLIFLNCFCIMMFVPWYFWNESIKVAFFYMTAYRLLIILNFTWGINSLAHMYGYKPYDNIGPVENSLMSYLTFGEGFHNYHHTFPYDYKAGEYSTDGRNTTTKFIDLFASIGWVWDRKTAGDKIIAERKRRGDGYDNHERGASKRFMDIARVLFMCAFYGYII